MISRGRDGAATSPRLCQPPGCLAAPSIGLLEKEGATEGYVTASSSPTLGDTLSPGWSASRLPERREAGLLLLQPSPHLLWSRPSLWEQQNERAGETEISQAQGLPPQRKTKRGMWWQNAMAQGGRGL